MKNLALLIKNNWVVIFTLPILIPFFIYARNYSDTPIGVFLRVSLISIALFSLLLGSAFLIFHKSKKAILFSSITFIMLSLYGDLYGMLEQQNSIIGHHKILAAVYLVLIIILAFAINKRQISPNAILTIKIMTLFFMTIQIFQLLPNLLESTFEKSTETANSSLVNGQLALVPAIVDSTENITEPDVYYIILDLYARADVIQKDFAFDNSDFINSLQSKGFYIPNCSRSNYMITENSLASSLNLNYLQDLVDQTESKGDIESQLINMIKNPEVINIFQSLDYEINTFQTGYSFTEITNVDHYFEPNKPVAFLGSIHPYEILLLKGSIFKILYDTNIPVVKTVFDKITFPYTDHVNLQFFIFDRLTKIASDPQPTFTFAHITIPHTPFVFRANGTVTTDHQYYAGLYDSPISNDLFVEGYVNQVEFVNQKIILTINEIINNSDTPPIIIIQGDHGVDLDNRLPIFNAYYFPNIKNPGFYPTLSPVNTFRLLFNDYFEADFPILEDVSFSGLYDTPDEWISEPEQMEDCLK